MKAYVSTFALLFVVLAAADTIQPNVYSASNVQKSDTGLTADLTLTANNDSRWGDNFTNLKFVAHSDNEYQLHIKITNADAERWEIPVDNTPTIDESKAVDSLYQFDIVEEPFSFTVCRKANNEILFTTDSTKITSSEYFYFADQLIQLATPLPQNPNIYGLGERVHEFKLDTEEDYYVTWALDNPSPYDDGKAPGKNMYGPHPFYMEARPDSGNYHGVFFANTNAQDVHLTDSSLAWHSVGGIVELYFFMGPTPLDVIKQYQTLVGRPAMVPFWGLGWHQCRYGYTGLEEWKGVHDSYIKNNLPLDTLWTDIDYMEKYYDFTLGTDKWGPQSDFIAFINQMKSEGRQYIPILDAGVAKQDYFGFNEGTERDVWIKRFKGSDDPFVGKVWPGLATFVDWFHPNATDYWMDMLAKTEETVGFAGLWLDMNETSNFCNGEQTGDCASVYPDQGPLIPTPYTPGMQDLEMKNIAMAATHYGGDLNMEYNTHGLYGFMESVATNKYFTEVKKERSMIISRSTYPGHGAVAGHWLGDNFSEWNYLKWSIPGVLNFQMYGVPLVGADICGFINDTTEELCARWMALGNMYPFARNHNTIGTISQEPYALGDTVLAVSQKYIRMRYSLIHYIYYQFVQANREYTPVWRHMMWEYPNDTKTLDMDEQFLLGEAILVTPALYQGQTSVTAYFPDDIFYDFDGNVISNKAQTLTVDAPIDVLPMYIRGGYAIIMQDASDAMTLKDLASKPLNIIIALGSDGTASGQYYFDDGISVDSLETRNYADFSVKFNSPNEIAIGPLSANQTYKVDSYQGFGTVTLFGFTKKMTSAYVSVGCDPYDLPEGSMKQEGTTVTFSSLPEVTKDGFALILDYEDNEEASDDIWGKMFQLEA